MTLRYKYEKVLWELFRLRSSRSCWHEKSLIILMITIISWVYITKQVVGWVLYVLHFVKSSHIPCQEVSNILILQVKKVRVQITCQMPPQLVSGRARIQTHLPFRSPCTFLYASVPVHRWRTRGRKWKAWLHNAGMVANTAKA